MSNPVRPIDPLADELALLVGEDLGYRTATTINLGMKDLAVLIDVLKTRRPLPQTIDGHPVLKLVE